MLLSVSIENWRSFAERAEFSMLAGNERQFNETLQRIKSRRMRVLPLSAIYGGNASGKSNFIKAIAFARKLIVNGNPPNARIPVEPFRLDPEHMKKPVTISFEIFTNDKQYEYGFSTTAERIVEEWLIEIGSTREWDLFRRSEKEFYINEQRVPDAEKMLYFSMLARKNQLFIFHSIDQNFLQFSDVYNWFRDDLVFMAPDDRFGPTMIGRYFKKEDPLSAFLDSLLQKLDTGVHGLCKKKVNLKDLHVPQGIIDDVREKLSEGGAVVLSNLFEDELFLFTMKKSKLEVLKLASSHTDWNGKKVIFDLAEESDGTRRLMHLGFVFWELSRKKSQRTIFVDEIDRCLHSQLLRRLIYEYQKTRTADTRTQLIFTTHDLLLMDQQLLRRDEMWFTERDKKGRSSIFSLADFKDVRFDKDVRKSYLQGRYGAIPRMIADCVFERE